MQLDDIAMLKSLTSVAKNCPDERDMPDCDLITEPLDIDFGARLL